MKRNFWQKGLSILLTTVLGVTSISGTMLTANAEETVRELRSYATPSVNYVGYNQGADRFADDDMTTFWNGHDEKKLSEQWMMYDFGDKTAEISACSINWADDGNGVMVPKEITIQYEGANGEWASVAPANEWTYNSKNAGDAADVYEFAPVQTSKIRVVITLQNNGDGVGHWTAVYDWKLTGHLVVDKTALQAAVDAAKTDADTYTGESWTSYQAALDKAREVLADEAATQEEVDVATEGLKEAEVALKTSAEETGDVNLALTANPSVTNHSNWEKGGEALNDGSLDNGQWGTYGIDSASEYAQYNWMTPVVIKSSNLYIWDDNPDSVYEGIQTPASYVYEYLPVDSDTWVTLLTVNTDIVGSKEGSLNAVTFNEPVVATALRCTLNKNMPEGTTSVIAGVGLKEWEVYGTVIVNVESIGIQSVPEDKVNVGDTVQLTAAIAPEDATIKDVAWSSSDTEVVTVDANGVATGVRGGTATITATAKDGSGVTGTIEITAIELQKHFTITAKSENDDMGTITGAGIYDEGTVVTLNAIAKEGYCFAGWYVGEECVSKESAWSVTVNEESAAKEFVAKFSKDLVAIKAGAIADLESYKNTAEYRAEQREILAKYIEAGTKAINAAETEEAVASALEGAKNSLDSIVTDLQLTITEYETAMSEAESVLGSYKEGEYLSEQEDERIAILNKALEEYVLLTENVDSSSAAELKDIMASVNTLVEKAKTDVDALPTAADLTVTGVSIKDGAELAIQVDTTYTLGVDVTGGEKADKTVTWYSDNQEVATVAEDGTVTAVSAGTAVITAKVRINPDSDYLEAKITITVEPRKYEVCVKNGEAVEKIGEFEEWALAKVEAPAAPEGKKFAYWKTSEGKIVCYASNYSFYVMQNVTLEPIYAEDDTAVKEQVTILCTASYNKSKKQLSFTSKRSLPAGYTVVSHGIVITDSTGWGRFGQDAEKLIIGASRTKKAVATTRGRLGTYVAKMTCTASDTWYGRAYVTYKDKNGEEHTVYSDGAASCAVVVNN